MYHLAQEEYAFIWIFFQRAIANFNGIFYSVAKTKVPGYEKLNRAKVQLDRAEILLARVLCSSYFFDLTGDG